MILKIIKSLWHLLPTKFRTKVRFVLSGGAVLLDPTYADDGLISQHITSFMTDKNFIESLPNNDQNMNLHQWSNQLWIILMFRFWEVKIR